MVAIREQERHLSPQRRVGYICIFGRKKKVAPYALVCGSLRTPYMNSDKSLYLVLCFGTKG